MGRRARKFIGIYNRHFTCTRKNFLSFYINQRAFCSLVRECCQFNVLSPIILYSHWNSPHNFSLHQFLITLETMRMLHIKQIFGWFFSPFCIHTEIHISRPWCFPKITESINHFQCVYHRHRRLRTSSYLQLFLPRNTRKKNVYTKWALYIYIFGKSSDVKQQQQYSSFKIFSIYSVFVNIGEGRSLIESIKCLDNFPPMKDCAFLIHSLIVTFQ